MAFIIGWVDAGGGGAFLLLVGSRKGVLGFVRLHDLLHVSSACEIYPMQQPYGKLDRQLNPQTFALCGEE